MNKIEVSVVMPCLNEAATVGICIAKAQETMEALGITGEVIIADNGSSDNSVEIAEKTGAKVVHQPVKGYGSAYMAGFAAAQGKYIVMGDSDDSYDWTDLQRFIQPLREGADMVIGNRVGGTIIKGAMPFLHRYFGVPVLTTMLNVLFGGKIGDAHCGMRSFTREAYDKMHLETTGMEFASEMIIKAKQAGLKIAEIPITLHPDGRPGKPHLKSFTDGWRHVRFMLNYHPGFLYFLPGLILLALGVGGLLGHIINSLAEYPENPRTMLWGTAFAAAGFTGFVLYLLGIIAYAKNYTGHFPKAEKFTEKFFRNYKSGQGIWKGIVSTVVGIVLLSDAAMGVTGFSFLGVLLIAMGVITIFASFLLGQMNVFGKE